MAITLDLDTTTGGTGATTSFTEQTPTLLFTNASLGATGGSADKVDSISVTLSGATATESLSLDATGAALATSIGVTVTYTPGTGVLLLSGSNELTTDWTTLLNHILYNNTSDTPTGPTRTVTVTATNTTPAESATATDTINVTSVNDQPVNTVPGGLEVAVDGDKVFNSISVSDVDNTTLTVTLSVNNGTLTLASLTGLSFTTGDGTGDATMTFSGTQTNINAALNGLAYSSNITEQTSGDTDDVLTITTSDGTLQDIDTIDIDVTCFMPGTRILTPTGEVNVETLKRGDLVTTTDGRHMPVSWLGRQTVSRVFADPLRVLPIRIKASALGDNVPSRDLLISPDHAILLDGVLVQAGALVNGTSVVRETNVPQTYTLYHVELDGHSLILAENVPSETFIDNVDRLAFDNWNEHQALYPQGKALVEMAHPRAQSHRQVPGAIRARLAERAAAAFAAASATAA